MATGAGAQHRGVIHPRDTGEITGTVAILTAVQRLKMTGRLTQCRCAVVAAGATARHPAVVKHRPAEAIGAVAIVAGIAALDMVGRFARGRGAIMATGTGAQHRRMIYLGDTGEVAGVMAVLAAIQGLDMRG